MTGRSPLPDPTPSSNRNCCSGPTVPRSTPSPGPTCSPQRGSWTPSSGWSPPQGDATDTTITTAAVDMALLEATANGVSLNAGQIALVRDMSTSGCPVAAGDRAGRHRQNNRDASPRHRVAARRRHRHWARPHSCRGRGAPRSDPHPLRNPRQTHHLPAPAAAAGVGGRHRSRPPWW